MESELPQNIIDDAEVVSLNLLPDKSREVYLRKYENFMAGKAEQKIDKNCFSEKVMLVYFDQLANKYAPNTVWVEYSMLRTTIQVNHNMDIGYSKLNSLLKKKMVGYHPKKAKIFQPDEISRFLSQADDLQFLAAKVIMIFGIYGATRTDELTKIEVKDVKEQGAVFVVKLRETKTNIIRTFTVEDEYTTCVRNYRKLRAPNTPHNRFFVNFQKGRCTTQPIRKNKFMSATKVIANFLKLEDADQYSGHSFRRTSATLLADAGGDLLMLKRHGGWRSATVAEGYVDESIENKRKIGNLISSAIGAKRTTSNRPTSTITSSAIESREIVCSQSTYSATESSENASSATISTFGVLSQINVINTVPNNVQGVLDDTVKGMQFHNCSNVSFQFTFYK